MMDRQRRDDETEDNDGDRVRWHGGNETKRYLSTHGQLEVRPSYGRSCAKHGDFSLLEHVEDSKDLA
ncbi:hypothetical protein E2562_034163 [Oryza meyeriana var. granulata]|uniref:Uncharacterized protein n=1 Tax=Oryza meyeriana var. granulata TaxID=110450 RepID=A0A6G1ES91_9ORYZ|nr:hypothetical protein E2562_034163 [Oryza meyeriana var. granulata]